MTLEIFVPFWGDPSLLYETVDSVIAQENPDWRLIVIDDCYPDPSVAEHFEKLDDARVTYTRNETNLGITENYREAIRRATTEFITILGCDDLLHPNYVDVMSRTIAAVPATDVIQPGVEVIDEQGTVVRPLVDRVKQGLLAPRGRGGIAVLQGERMATSLIRGDWLYWPSLAFRTDSLRRIDFRDGLPIIQDLALLMDIAFEGGTLAYNPTLAFAYRRHGSSASQKTLLDGRRFRDERTYYAMARSLAAAKGWRSTARTARVRAMSRLHGIAELPGVIRHGTSAGIQSTVAHIFAP
ncbi:glycosyltransferase [Microbacterium immunditiarum]|uniref:Glycosyltransferase involved in cell wall biosynthesis n=1 Tax=Microbacterium immunditiarum TaxID=337480 RepID=A0A7Y9GR52_9MICO|nr:glycosyltransferase [Microbacterium immunditiarum]NYE21012.1 glycosyltransferase involved in cell wall biosynthesis [Microbacterium immunditiarum]